MRSSKTEVCMIMFEKGDIVRRIGYARYNIWSYYEVVDPQLRPHIILCKRLKDGLETELVSIGVVNVDILESMKVESEL